MSFVAPFTGGIVQPSNTSYLAVTISANYAPVWPSVAADTPNVVANINAVTATVGGLTITMPPANQVGVASPSIWINTGAQTFTLVDQNNNTILAITAGQVWFVYLTDDSTAQGTWATFQFSATTSQATPAALAGNGLVAIGSTLNTAHPVEFTAATGYTVSATDRSQVLVWNGGAGIINLPSAAAIGNNFFLLLRNDGSGIETLTPNGSDLIDGASSFTLNPSESVILVSSGLGWVAIGYGRSITISTTQVLVNCAGNSNITLTSAQASNLLIQLIGALTGSINVIVPTNVATYHFYNNTTGTFQITVTTAGGTGVVVPQGTHAILDCDGTNVVNAVNGFISGALIPVSPKSALFSTAAGDRGTCFVITGGAPFVVTLLGAPTAGNGYYVIIQNNSAGVITLTPAAGTIAGAASLLMQPGDELYAISDGTNYQAVRPSPTMGTVLAVKVASGSLNVTFSTEINWTGFSAIAIMMLGVQPSLNNVQFQATISEDNGGTFKGAGYSDGGTITFGAATSIVNNPAAAAWTIASVGQSNSATDGLDGTLTLFTPSNTALNKNAKMIASYAANGPVIADATTSHRYSGDQNAFNGIRFAYNGGATISGGTFIAIGLRGAV